jgi:hypothetical protein
MSKGISRHLLAWKHAEGILSEESEDSLPENSMKCIGILVNLDREIDI